MVRGASEAGARVVAIVGMHRSGTSWLAGSLQAMGLELGDVATRAPNNPRGNRESRVVQRLHDEVLRSNGGSWASPPATVRWSPEHREELRAFVEEMDRGRVTWGFKDPRTILVLDGWRDVLGDRLSLVGIFRHPDLVIGSLEARRRRRRGRRAAPGLRPRRRWSGRRGRRLWEAYNGRIVDVHRRAPFPLVRFDQPARGLLGTLEVLGENLGLASSADTATFFDESFLNQPGAEGPVHRSCRATWEYLSAHEGFS